MPLPLLCARVRDHEGTLGRQQAESSGSGSEVRAEGCEAEGASRILFKREIKAAEDPQAKAAEIAQEYRAEFASPYQAAANAMITDVIEPAKTRSVISLALRNTLSKRDTRPPKKHGNIPL